MPTLPPTRVPIHYTSGSGSSAPTLPAPTARSVVVGNAGGLPVPGFRFDGDTTLYLDESVVARLEPEHCTIQTDLSVLYSSVRLTGGAATLLPDGARITGLLCLNREHNGGSGPWGWPFQSHQKNAWDDSLCVLAVDADQGGAGVYYSTWDGALYRWPVTVQARHLCVAEWHSLPDAESPSGLLYIGTPHGVYARSSNVRDQTSPWQRVGSFARRVVRLETRVDAGGGIALWALVQDQAGGKTYHAIYRYPGYPGAASSPELEGGWQPIIRAGELVDMVPAQMDVPLGTDTVFYIAKADPGNVHCVTLDSGGGTVTDTALALPSASQGTHLSHVLGISGHSVDAVLCSVAGAASPLYKSIGAGGVFGPFTDADSSGALKDPSGNTVGVNTVAESNLTLLGWVSGALEGAAGPYVQAWACTTSGLFWTDDLANPWRAVSSASGLDDVSVGRVAAGQWIALLGGPITPLNRVFATNSERCYVSHTQTNLWSEGAPHSPVSVGPYLSGVIAQTSGGLPENNLQTVGPMSTSPLGGLAGSHLQIPGVLPDGWYWLRTLSQYQEMEWSLVNGNVSLSRLVEQQVSDLAAEGSSRVALLTAAGRLVETSISFLGEHSTPRVDLTLQTTFTTQEAAARLLRASMQVPVRYHGQMLARSSSGDALATITVDLSDALFFVKSVKFASSSEMGPGACTATVELSTSLAQDRDASAIAAAMLDALSHHAKRHRGRR